MNTKKKYCGQITILGKTNVGKSTLINHIIGKKISIVSRKKNTTQISITGIKTQKYYQFIYVDTPGIIFNAKNNEVIYNKKNFFNTVNNSILIIFIIDRLFWTKNDDFILHKIKKTKIPVIIVINKIDKISNKNILLPFIDFLQKKNNNTKIIPICAKKTKNIDFLSNIIQSYLPQNPHIYPKNYMTTNSRIFTTSEIIREQLIFFLGDELPSIIKVKIEEFQKKETEELYIRAVVLIQNIRQKKIIIGHNGEKIKKISIISRRNIEKEFHVKTHLFLWVKEYISK